MPVSTGPTGPPVSPYLNPKAAAAAKAAAKSKATAPPKNPKGHTNPNPLVVADGGRVQPTAKSKAKKAAGDASGTTTAPTTTDPGLLSPEDVALQGNYDPSQFNNLPDYGKAGTGGTDLASQFNAGAYAKGMAGMQYDPAITQLATRIKGIVQALPGSLASLHKAFANVDAANAVRQGQIGGPTTAAANQLQGTSVDLQNQAATNAGIAQDTREADWAQRIKLLSGANVNDMRGQLTGLTKARGDAQVGYYNQGIKTKSDLVSQAIANINSMRASNISAGLAGGLLEGQGLGNEAKALANQQAGISNAYAPYFSDQQLQTGNQGLQMGQLSIEDAKTKVAQSAPNKTLKGALDKLGPSAVDAFTAMVVPPNGVVPDSNGYSHVRGNPNDWVKQGVAQIMTQLPNSKRENVVKYVNTIVARAVSPAGGWKQNKNGNWVRPK